MTGRAISHYRRLGRACLPGLIGVTLLASASCGGGRTPPPERPNVVLIMTDNHGAWTLGCYGNQEIRTPNIDRLAEEGVLFTRVFSSNAVCSPTRATFLTGLMPSQHGVHRYLGRGGAQVGPQAFSTIAEFRTLPEILAEAGYVCGLSGKWHLGGNMEPQEGFTFWVTKPHGHTAGFYDQPIIENGEVHTEPSYLTQYWTRRGIEFIEQSIAQNPEQPFFLFLAYNGPYGLGSSMLRPPRNRHAEYYAGKPLDSFPREQVHPWLHSTRNLINQPAAILRYAAEVSGVDDGVGEIMRALREHDLDEDTLVIFTADQGLAGGHSGLWGMGDHTRPLTAFDGTMWIPMMFRHRGRIPAGRRSDIMVSNYDFLPTLLDYLGLEDEMPAEPAPPGRSFAPVLDGETLEWDDVTFYEFENVRAVRTPQWKYIERIHQEPNELYDLTSDPGERNNLINSPAHAKTRGQLRERLYQFFERHADPKWDLWKGGASKSGLLTGELFGLEDPYK